MRAQQNSIRNIRYAISKNIENKLNQAAITGFIKATSFARQVSFAQIAFGTWKAICRRNGAKYSTGRKITHHWNEAFLAPFLEPLTIPWKYVFREKIPELHSGYSEKIIQSLVVFKGAMEEMVSTNCISCPAITRILAQMPNLEDSLRERVATAMKRGQNHAQSAHRRLETTILEQMRSYYDEAKVQSGR